MQTVFSMQPIGFVQSPYTEAGQIPKGCGAQHPAEGILERVFSTRSPRRPNRLGLTVVELVKREGTGCTQEQLRRGWLGEAEKRAGE